MARLKKEPASTTAPSGAVDLQAGLDKLLAIASKAGDPTILASDIPASWRYMDFCDVTVPGRPCLPMEYLFGTRGLLAGRLVMIVADEAVGKSSMLYLLYGMMQRTCSVWGEHHDTEQALMPPDRIHALGCDPSRLLTVNPGSLEAATAEMSSFVQRVRTQIDVERKIPICLSLDSISAAAEAEIDDVTGEVDGDKGLGKHARTISQFLRGQLRYLAISDVALMFTAQWRANINLDPMRGGNPHKTKTFIAERPCRFHASWLLDMTKYKLDDGGVNVGDRIMITMDKNKLAPKARTMELHLYRDRKPAWDFTKANIDLLFGSGSPLPEGKFESGGGWYKCDGIGDGKKMRAEDFVNAFYTNEALIMECRERLKIRGFGFKFETDYAIPAELEKQDAEEKPNG